MIQQHLLDPVSSCMFAVATTPNADKELRHTVLRETAEELFGEKEVRKRTGSLDPYWFYEKPYVSDILKMIEAGSASFDVTGFCVDLVRCVPEITTVLVIRDETYFKRYRPLMHLGPEHIVSTLFKFPRDLRNVDRYLAEQIVTDPDGDLSRRGFDPTRWTLPGGFSFRQGLSKAAERKLL
ncbi:MAG TPA: hypothetical protein VLI39_00925 [Sedimentisphaerales bacterium]|nr:hypothetical protein [Sedimentisphaerales bacterium]